MRKIRVFYQKYSVPISFSTLSTFPFRYFHFFCLRLLFLYCTHFYLNHSLEIHIYIESLPLETFIGSRVKSPFSYTLEIWLSFPFSFEKYFFFFCSIFDISKMYFLVYRDRNVHCTTHTEM